MAWVLVVDDERSVREAFSLFLEQEGHTVWSAADAEEALVILKSQPLDVVVSDIILPKTSGVELLEGITKGWPAIRCILITGEPSIDTAARAVRAGAHDYLTKPVMASKLQRAVATAARFKSLRDRNRRLRHELLDSNREYETLLRRISDELSRPLHAILVSSSALSAGLEADQFEHEIERIRSNSVQLNQLVSQVKHLAVASHQRIRPRILDLRSIARDIAVELRLDYPHRVSLDMGEDLVASGDPGLIRDALHCLLDNAWKFTSRCDLGHIWFTVSQDDGERVFCIRDNGVGLPQKDAERVFEPFETAADEQLSGPGTGLAIARRIIHRHGGRIWADSQAGQGASLYFTLGAFP